jgi:hypothetical protein
MSRLRIVVENEALVLCRYLNIEVLSPCIEDGFNIVRSITPHEVRAKLENEMFHHGLFAISVVYVTCLTQHRSQSMWNTPKETNGSFARMSLSDSKIDPHCSTMGAMTFFFSSLPIMLRSCKCVLYQKNETEMAKMKECPLDPGGYFITRGEFS